MSSRANNEVKLSCDRRTVSAARGWPQSFTRPIAQFVKGWTRYHQGALRTRAWEAYTFQSPIALHKSWLQHLLLAFIGTSFVLTASLSTWWCVGLSNASARWAFRFPLCERSKPGADLHRRRKRSPFHCGTLDHLLTTAFRLRLDPTRPTARCAFPTPAHRKRERPSTSRRVFSAWLRLK